MRKWIILIVACLLVMSIAVIGYGQERISLGTAGLTSSYYAVGSGVANAINKGVDGISVSAEDTGASVENCNLIQIGDAELGIAASNIAYQSYMGEGAFEGHPNKDLRGVTTLFPEAVYVVVLKESSIQSFEDLRGKKVSVYKPGSGTEVMARRMFKLHGMTFDDFRPEHLSYAEAGIGLKDKTLDAIFLWSGIPTPGIVEIATVRPVRVVPIAQDKLDIIQAESSYCSPTVIKKEIYKGMEEDTPTIAIPAVLVCDGNLDEELVYSMTKAIFENNDLIAQAHVRGKNVTLENATKGMSIPFHPGAEKYYREMGIIQD